MGHTDRHSLHVFRGATPAYSIQNTQQTVTGAHWYLYIVGYVGFIMINIKGTFVVQKGGEIVDW